MLAALPPVMNRTAGLRRFGAASLDLAYVAAGRFDAFWETGLAPWDVAAGIILIREAGGMVTELNGKAYPLKGDTILATNSALHDPVGKMLRDAIRGKRD
jgi:myo-inositol-1(or 4)-monophosphatase